MVGTDNSRGPNPRDRMEPTFTGSRAGREAGPRPEAPEEQALPQIGGLYADGPPRMAGAQGRGSQPDYTQKGGSADQGRARLGARPAPPQPRGSQAKSGDWLSPLVGNDPATRKLVGGAVVVVALLAGTVGAWALLGHHHEGVPVIGPPSVPVKDQPADPGGMQIMSDDAGPSDVTGKGAVHLAPLPEQPDAQALAHEAAARQEPAKPAPPPAAVTQTPLPAQSEQSDMTPASPSPLPATVPPKAEEQQAAQQKLEEQKQAEQRLQEKREAERRAAEKRAEERRAAQEKAQARAALEAKKAAAAKAAAARSQAAALPAPAAEPSAPVATAASGHFAVQLGALDSPALAHKAWETSKRKAPDLLGGHTPVYSQVTRDGHTYTRLRVSGFEDMKAARAFCAKLHAQSVNCAPAAF